MESAFTYLLTDSLIPYAKNTKRHPPEQIEAIAVSISNFGFDQPIVVTPQRVVIKGHGRLLAAKSLGMVKVPVVIREVSDTDAIFLRETDNRLQSKAWDLDNLASELRELLELGHLDSTLFLESEIPSVTPFVLGGKQQEFDLATSHICNKCSYAW